MSGSDAPGTPRRGERFPAGQSGDTTSAPARPLVAASSDGQRVHAARPSHPGSAGRVPPPVMEPEDDDAGAATIVSAPATEVTVQQPQAPLPDLLTRLPLEPAGKIPAELNLSVPPLPAIFEQPTVNRNGDLERPTVTPELHELHWNTASVSLPLPGTGANAAQAPLAIPQAWTVQAVSLFAQEPARVIASSGPAPASPTPVSAAPVISTPAAVTSVAHKRGGIEDGPAATTPARRESGVYAPRGQGSTLAPPAVVSSSVRSVPLASDPAGSEVAQGTAAPAVRSPSAASLDTCSEAQKQTRIAALDSLYEPEPVAGGRPVVGPPRAAEPRAAEPRAAAPHGGVEAAPNKQEPAGRSTAPLRTATAAEPLSVPPLAPTGGRGSGSTTPVKAPPAQLGAPAASALGTSGLQPSAPAGRGAEPASAPALTGGAVEQLEGAPALPEQHRLEPGVVLKEYELLEQVGEGGMAVIYKARHLRTGALVAVKALHAHQQTVLAGRRFDREFRAIQSIEHEHIVRVMGQGKYYEQAYIIMEFVEGHDLKAHMKVLKMLPPEERWREIERIVMQLCDALDRIHKCNLIHRDLKPSNILLTQNYEVKLTDFGVAKPLDPGNEQLTSPGMLVGTLAYLAPEVFEQGVQTPRLDLYALGVMLYVLLTEKLPFAGKNIVQIMQKHLKHVPEVPQAVNPDVPSYLSELTMRLLAKRQEERPQNALEVIRAIVVGRGSYQVKVQEPQSFGDVWKPRFVGRSAELGQLHDAIYRLSTGNTGELVLVEGTEGSGRSRLIEQGLLYARQLGLPIYTGRCVPGGQGWGEGFRNIMREVQAEVGRSAFDQFPRSRLQTILSVYERAEQPNPVTTPTTAPLQDFEGEIMTVLRALLLKSKTPRILWIQQLEYADPGTLLALKDAVRQLCRGFHLLVVASCRPLTPGSGFLYETFCQGSLVSWVKRIPLAPLQQEELGQLVGALLGGDPRSLQVAQRLAMASGGQPMIAVELLRFLMDRRMLMRLENQHRWKLMSRNSDEALNQELDAHMGAQLTLAHVLLLRLQADSSKAKQILYLLAVWGYELRPSTLARLLSTTEDVLMQHVHYLRRLGWLMDTWVGGVEAWQLAHPFYRAFLLHVLRRDENKKTLQGLEFLVNKNRNSQLT